MSEGSLPLALVSEARLVPSRIVLERPMALSVTIVVLEEIFEIIHSVHVEFLDECRVGPWRILALFKSLTLVNCYLI